MNTEYRAILKNWEFVIGNETVVLIGDIFSDNELLERDGACFMTRRITGFNILAALVFTESGTFKLE